MELGVIDQYGQARSWDNETWVTAKLDPRGAGGALLEGARVNRSLEGTVEFNNLSVNMEGTFSLKFFLDGGAEIWEEDVVVRVNVGEGEAEGKLSDGGVCFGLFDSFSCYTDEPPRGKDVSARASDTDRAPLSYTVLRSLRRMRPSASYLFPPVSSSYPASTFWRRPGSSSTRGGRAASGSPASTALRFSIRTA